MVPCSCERGTTLTIVMMVLRVRQPRGRTVPSQRRGDHHHDRASVMRRQVMIAMVLTVRRSASASELEPE
jgi:hypothetical protein